MASDSLAWVAVARACAASGEELGDYAALHAWSVRESERFWALLWEFAEVIAKSAALEAALTLAEEEL